MPFRFSVRVARTRPSGVNKARMVESDAVRSETSSRSIPALEAMNTSNCHPPPIVLQKTTVLHKPMRKPTTQNKPPPPAIISFSSDEWNKDLAPAAPAEKRPEAITLERDAVDERIPLEARGLPEWEGSHSLIDALVAHGLPGLEVSDARRLAHVCKVLKRDMEDDEVWRLQCAMLAKEHDLYAPASSCNWRQVRASKQRSQSTAQPPSQPSLNSSLHMFARVLSSSSRRYGPHAANGREVPMVSPPSPKAFVSASPSACGHGSMMAL